jgi:hypothetical protein
LEPLLHLLHSGDVRQSHACALFVVEEIAQLPVHVVLVRRPVDNLPSLTRRGSAEGC